MLVKWKILCSFGLIFWLTMCVIDYVFGNIINKNEFSKIQEIPFDDEEDPGYTGWKQITVWGMCSFTASFVGCIMMKFLKLQINKYSQGRIVDSVEQADTTSTVRVAANSSGIAIKFEQAIPEKDRNSTAPNLNLLEAVKDFPVTTESSEITTRLVEKRCSKLKEEMREMQMNTWKEYSSLNKKLDGLSKEKADLGRQLQQAHKDNKQLRQQLDDILGDRTLLIKRLECATKEIKLNTSSKQMTLDKLEEAVSCSNHMRLKISQLTKEKDDWEAKYKHVEEKYRALKAQVKISLEKRISNQAKAVDVEAEMELEQSEKDIAKVQNKLLDLEKSLEKMRQKPVANVSTANEEDNVRIEHLGDVQLDSTRDGQASEISNEKGDNSEKNSTSKRTGDGLEFEENTMDLSREGTAESGDQSTEIIESTEEPDGQFDPQTDTTTACQVSAVRTISTPNSNMSSASSRTDESILSIEESETDVMYPPGIVSQSPAFQKFLLKVLESPVV